jgi:hypothetical protein
MSQPCFWENREAAEAEAQKASEKLRADVQDSWRRNEEVVIDDDEEEDPQWGEEANMRAHLWASQRRQAAHAALQRENKLAFEAQREAVQEDRRQEFADDRAREADVAREEAWVRERAPPMRPTTQQGHAERHRERHFNGAAGRPRTALAREAVQNRLNQMQQRRPF